MSKPERKPNVTYIDPRNGKALTGNHMRAKNPGINMARQEELKKNLGEKSITKAMEKSGYSEHYSNNGDVKKTKTFQELVKEHLSDEKVVKRHGFLLESRRLDHMVFPTKMEDELIEELLESVNCTLRKIVHSEQAKHAYFWAYDSKAVKDALDMAYKLKGSYAPEKVEDVSKYSSLSTEELARRKKAAIAFYKKQPQP